MPLLRLLVACLLAVALPLQGLATTSMRNCDQHQQSQQEKVSLSLPLGADLYASQADQEGAKGKGVEAGEEMLPLCKVCGSSCCQSAASPDDGIGRGSFAPLGQGPAARNAFTSWAEPVPHKPPRT